jgi:hypothetical protein
MPTTIHDIILKFLKENGYTGLYNDDWECGCNIKDFTMCGDLSTDCCVGYYNDCSTCTKKINCNVYKNTYFSSYTTDKICWEGEETKT